jgi:hypothetical protein
MSGMSMEIILLTYTVIKHKFSSTMLHSRVLINLMTVRSFSMRHLLLCLTYGVSKICTGNTSKCQGRKVNTYVIGRCP